ncbi:hypothetical protein FKP32DRAFT_1673557, partial [Trametes sanguinea]
IVSTILLAPQQQEREGPSASRDFTTRLAVVIKQCGEDQLLSKLGLVLFEQVGEEYPDPLGSIFAAEGAIANVAGMAQMNPPVKNLLPRLTPILHNIHEKGSLLQTSQSAYPSSSLEIPLTDGPSAHGTPSVSKSVDEGDLHVL